MAQGHEMGGMIHRGPQSNRTSATGRQQSLAKVEAAGVGKWKLRMIAGVSWKSN